MAVLMLTGDESSGARVVCGPFRQVVVDGDYLFVDSADAVRSLFATRDPARGRWVVNGARGAEFKWFVVGDEAASGITVGELLAGRAGGPADDRVPGAGVGGVETPAPEPLVYTYMG